MEKIKDINTYIEKMCVGLQDKTFFLKEINMEEVEVIVDIGSADGTMLAALRDLFPDKIYIGYDNNMDMARLAKEKHINTFIDLDWLIAAITQLNKPTLVICSSVLHEMYSYNDSKAWREITDLQQVKYVAIRDMALQYHEDSIDKEKMFNAAIEQRQILFSDYLKHRAYSTYTGVELPTEDLIEFFLKYEYVANWERERDERYFYPLSSFDLRTKGYEEVYMERFNILPQMSKIKETFGVDLTNIQTHYKRIFKRV